MRAVGAGHAAEQGDPSGAERDQTVEHGLDGMAGPYRPHLARRFAPLLVEPEGDALDGAVKLARSLGTAEAP